MEEFVRRLRIGTNNEKCFAFFLGAGCSVSSGIPSSESLVRDSWIPRLRDIRAPSRSDLETWVCEELPDYDAANPALSYADLIGRLFFTADERQNEIEDLCEGREPSYGYAVLAQLVALDRGRFNVVLTTNFDDLIADALYLYTDSRPLVIHHESLAGFIRPTRTRPLIVKLHGDHRLSPRNTALEIESLEREIQRHTSMVLHDRGIIFIGYGGGDPGILKLLNSLPDKALPYGAFWVNPHEPLGPIRDWLLSRQGVWVRSNSFDEAMLLIQNAFGLKHPTSDRFNRIFENYQQKYLELSALIENRPDQDADVPALKKALTDADSLFPDFWKVISEANRFERRNPDRANKIYRKGIKQFPKAAPLVGRYAVFLKNHLHDYDSAEKMFKRALTIDPNHVSTIGNFAIFLDEIRKDYDKAEKLFKQAIAIDQKRASTLGNYAVFLNVVRKDFDAAEERFKQALEVDPKHVNTLSNYAIFLYQNRHDLEAAEAKFKQALAVDPKHVNTLDTYAVFLGEDRQDFDAAEALYKQALAVNPKHVNTLCNYAVFLTENRTDHAAAEELFKRALAADPNHIGTLNNYATFLVEERRNYEAADELYNRALKVLPQDTHTLKNYKDFQMIKRKVERIRGTADTAN